MRGQLTHNVFLVVSGGALLILAPLIALYLALTLSAGYEFLFHLSEGNFSLFVKPEVARDAELMLRAFRLKLQPPTVG
jgi:hypothetical protein